MFQRDNTLGKSIKDKSKSSTYKVTISLYINHFFWHSIPDFVPLKLLFY